MRNAWTHGRQHAGLLLAGLFSLSCIVEAPSGGPADELATQKGTTARAAPRAQPLTVKNGAVIGDKVELIGATVDPGVLRPGDSVRVSIAFKVLQEMKEDLMVFVHVEDVDGRIERMNVDHQPNNGKTPTSTWKVGQTVKDEFGLYLPPGLPVRGLNLWVGLWEPTRDVRLKLMNPTAVRNDGTDRVLLVTIPVQP